MVAYLCDHIFLFEKNNFLQYNLIIKTKKDGIMKVYLTEEQLEAIRNGDDLIIDGEKWELVDEFYRDTIDGDRVDTYIFKRPSDNRFFRINLFYLDGDDYREHLQDNYAYEVKKVVENIVVEKWVDLKLRKEFKTFFLRPI